MPFLKNFLCCLPLRNGCMWMAKLTVIFCLGLVVYEGWQSGGVSFLVFHKEKTKDFNEQLVYACAAGVGVSVIQYVGAKYKSRVMLLPSVVVGIAVETYLGYELYTDLRNDTDANAYKIKGAFKNWFRNAENQIEPYLLTLLYYIIAFVVILYMWLVVTSYMWRLQKIARVGNCKEADVVKGKDMSMVRSIGKSESGHDLFVMTLKE